MKMLKIISVFIAFIGACFMPLNNTDDVDVQAATKWGYVYPYGKNGGWFYYNYGTNSKYLNEFVSHAASEWNWVYASVKDNKGRKTCKSAESKYTAFAEIYRFSGRTATYYQGFKCYSDSW